MTLLSESMEIIKTFNAHYSADNITKRDEWMGWVNHQADVYDLAISELEKKMDKNNEITLSMFIDIKRNEIINFASKVVDERFPVTREQFNRIFKLYKEYEAIIEENHLVNGEVDVAYRIICESYEKHMENHSFIEDIRGYGNDK